MPERQLENGRGQNKIRGGSDPIAPQNRGPIPSGFGGSLPPLAAGRRSSCFGRVHTQMYSTLNAEKKRFRIKKGENLDASIESTTQTTQNNSCTAKTR